MSLQKLITLMMVLFLGYAITSTAQDLSAIEIAKKADAVVNAPKDQYLVP